MFDVILKKEYIKLNFQFESMTEAASFMETVLDNYFTEEGEKDGKLKIEVRRSRLYEGESEDE